MACEKNLLAMLIVLAVLARSSQYAAAFGCNDLQLMEEDIKDCTLYLTGKTDQPPTKECCSQAKEFNKRASVTKGHNQYAYCETLSAAARNYKFMQDRAEQLPVVCGFTAAIPFNVTDCSKYTY